MKNVILLFVAALFCWAGFSNSLYAQEILCIEDFENETPTGLMSTAGNWQTVAGSVAFELDANSNGTMILRGADGSGGSWMGNLIDYSGDLAADYCELCFDIRYVAGLNNPGTGINSIFVLQNTTNPNNIRLVFS